MFTFVEIVKNSFLLNKIDNRRPKAEYLYFHLKTFHRNFNVRDSKVFKLSRVGRKINLAQMPISFKKILGTLKNKDTHLLWRKSWVTFWGNLFQRTDQLSQRMICVKMCCSKRRYLRLRHDRWLFLRQCGEFPEFDTTYKMDFGFLFSKSHHLK